jgi:hypothetical protein
MRREILSWGDVEALIDHLLPQPVSYTHLRAHET